MIRPTVFLALTATTAFADAPTVVTDFAPIHSLTARVMQGVGAPDVLLPPGAEPHDFALSPGDATRLSQADLVIWSGPALMHWLTEPLATLAPDAPQLVLLETPGWEVLSIREGDDEGHEDHNHDAHDHGDTDPHAWLDPVVAGVWTIEIADALALADPANAVTYQENAAAAVAELTMLTDEITRQLLPLAGQSYVLPHDGYQYFEHRFGLPATAMIAGSEAQSPGPARIAALRDRVAQEGISCVMTDRETDPAWAVLLTENTTAKIGEIDGTGADIPLGPTAYPSMLLAIANSFSACLR